MVKGTQTGPDDLAHRGVAARLDALMRGAGEGAEGDRDGLFGAGFHGAIAYDNSARRWIPGPVRDNDGEGDGIFFFPTLSK